MAYDVIPETAITDLDWNTVETPCFVVDTRLLERNAAILASVRERVPKARVLLALKGFAMWSTFDVLRARLTAREITRLGNELRPGLPIGLLFWLAERGQLPFRPVLMTEEDEALIATVRERLAAPQRVKVSLDDL